MYRERPSRLVNAVVWRGSTASLTGAEQRVLPDGCMDLIWVEGRLLVAGPDTSAYLAFWPPGPGFVGLRFLPGTAPAFLGVAAHEMRDRVLPLADVWSDSRARRLTEYVAEAPDTERALEETAARRLLRAQPLDPRIPEVVRRAQANTPVAATAEAVGMNERQLHRRCLAAFGYGPKTLGRILRMNRALAMAREGTPPATAAVAAGYADQAHMARDVRALAGVPAGALIP